ncbi:MAG: hypothetical protein K0M74_11470 [Sphingopyxis sp.]|nr:hypothetical protein [Sphingopyxis sp.]MBW8296396.1 hypothetical protein [Sphingopyxis sp.]
MTRAGSALIQHPVTPDGRYFVARGRLWRLSDPTLSEGERERLVGALMKARRAVGAAKMSGNTLAERNARATVDQTKRALGERGPVWWDDGAPDYNRQMARSTPYATWFKGLS